MDDRFLDFLDSEEKAAIEILEEHGWIFLSEIDIEKATPEGDKWPSYVLGGKYPIGILRRPGTVDRGSSPSHSKKKRGRPKKS